MILPSGIGVVALKIKPLSGRVQGNLAAISVTQMPPRRLRGFSFSARSHSGRYQGPAWAARKETQASRHTPVLASRRVRERPHKVSTGRGGNVSPVAPSESRHPVKPGTCKSLGQGRRTSRHPWRNYCVRLTGRICGRFRLVVVALSKESR